MENFSERYGYSVPTVIVRGQITRPIQNCIYNWIGSLKEYLQYKFNIIEEDVWVNWMNMKKEDLYDTNRNFVNIILPYIDNKENEWYKKLDLVEVIISLLHKNNLIDATVDVIIRKLNDDFERLNFAYRVVEGRIIEVTAHSEIATIEEVVQHPIDNIKVHIDAALNLISASRQVSDYRNSIKESISAIELYVRTVTHSSTLGEALKKMERNGVVINTTLKEGFEKLYGYTNDKRTGIRHALMEDVNAPTSDEAIYMLVVCSAFINYLTKKNIQK